MNNTNSKFNTTADDKILTIEFSRRWTESDLLTSPDNPPSSADGYRFPSNGVALYNTKSRLRSLTFNQCMPGDYTVRYEDSGTQNRTDCMTTPVLAAPLSSFISSDTISKPDHCRSLKTWNGYTTTYLNNNCTPDFTWSGYTRASTIDANYIYSTPSFPEVDVSTLCWRTNARSVPVDLRNQCDELRPNDKNATARFFAPKGVYNIVKNHAEGDSFTASTYNVDGDEVIYKWTSIPRTEVGRELFANNSLPLIYCGLLNQRAQSNSRYDVHDYPAMKCVYSVQDLRDSPQYWQPFITDVNNLPITSDQRSQVLSNFSRYVLGSSCFDLISGSQNCHSRFDNATPSKCIRMLSNQIGSDICRGSLFNGAGVGNSAITDTSPQDDAMRRYCSNNPADQSACYCIDPSKDPDVVQISKNDDLKVHKACWYVPCQNSNKYLVPTKVREPSTCPNVCQQLIQIKNNKNLNINFGKIKAKISCNFNDDNGDGGGGTNPIDSLEELWRNYKIELILGIIVLLLGIVAVAYLLV
jgi:hypothetical protein